SYLLRLQQYLEKKHKAPTEILDIGKYGDNHTLQCALADLAEKIIKQQSPLQHTARMVKNVFSRYIPGLSFEAMGVKINLATLDTSNNQHVLNAELGLRQIMLDHPGTNASLLVDGLEQLNQVDTANDNIGRHFKTLLESNPVSVVLAGSTPELLQQAGGSQSQMDLYTRCDKVPLGRIPTKDWVPFIKEKFLAQHGSILSTESARFLLGLAENSTEHVVGLAQSLLEADPKLLSNDESIREHLRSTWMKIVSNNIINLDFSLWELDGEHSRRLLEALSKNGAMRSEALTQTVPGATPEDITQLMMNGYLTQDKVGCRLRLNSPLLKTYLSLDDGLGVLSCLNENCADNEECRPENNANASEPEL
ncbi:hypothetical protein N9Y80_07940, partial [Porticoccaceae bacterium]|nr:hypothetical protein [Porticoccaceae bacterium]